MMTPEKLAEIKARAERVTTEIEWIGVQGSEDWYAFIQKGPQDILALLAYIETLQAEPDQLRQANRRQQLTINRLNSEIGDLQAENKRLLEVIRLQAATHQEAPEIDPVALAVAAGQAGFDWMDND